MVGSVAYAYATAPAIRDPSNATIIWEIVRLISTLAEKECRQGLKLALAG